uniref:Uncharacterized protein n=1 Tax=mine drainage metagenome TaxID=410659 RepID=E6PDF6_9ZZZZ
MDAMLLGKGARLAVGVLDSAIGMPYQPFGRSAPVDRRLECVEHKARLHACTHRPPDHHSRKQVENDGEIEPALASSDVCYVACPTTIRTADLVGRELAIQDVRGDRILVVGIGRPWRKAAPTLPSDARRAHDAGNPVAPAVRLDKRRVDARRTVARLARGMNRNDLLSQLGIALLPRAYRAAEPRVVSTLRCLENAAHRADREFFSIRLDERVFQRDSLAKKVTAFFKMSRSSVRRAFSRCSFRICSSCDVSFPLPGNGALGLARYSRIHRYKVSRDSPSDRATEAAGSLESTTRRRASTLYSAGCWVRFFGMRHLSGPPQGVTYLGVH